MTQQAQSVYLVEIAQSKETKPIQWWILNPWSVFGLQPKKHEYNRIHVNDTVYEYSNWETNYSYW